MAKDDYDVIVYRVLVYLYACLKREICFDEAVFNASVKKDVSSEEYFTDVLDMMQREGLVEGITIIHCWGNEAIIASTLCEASITADGIRYLKENSYMIKTGEMLKAAADVISKLAAILMIN